MLPHSPAPSSNRTPIRFWVSLGVLMAVTAACAVVLGSQLQEGKTTPAPVDSLIAAQGAKLHPVNIRKPDGPPTVKTGVLDEKGQPLTVACATCHSTKPPNSDARLGSDLQAFHQGLKGHHGNLACTACHNPSEGYATLRLADGKSVPYTEVMQVCAQCHGPQYRDYQHGAHGGMTGYWDLTKGGRQRNNCIDCHDVHAPKYPVVSPVPGPRDRDPIGQGKRGARHE